MEFCVGDRVVAIKSYGRVAKGDTGTFVHKETIGPELGVMWDKVDLHKHNCQGHCESKHGWYVPEGYLAFAEPEDFGELPDLSSGVDILFG